VTVAGAGLESGHWCRPVLAGVVANLAARLLVDAPRQTARGRDAAGSYQGPEIPHK
jgi:hypothetical protein